METQSLIQLPSHACYLASPHSQVLRVDDLKASAIPFVVCRFFTRVLANGEQNDSPMA